MGKKRIFLPEVDSTNSYATKLLKNVKPEEGTLVYTDYQTHGRGQRGMVWSAQQASNLTFSVILKPNFLAVENYYYLYKMAALACYDTLAKIIDNSQFDIKIKWPNDILVNKQKIAGILIENSFAENSLQWSIMGIGMNVNQKLQGAPFNAVSIFDLIGKTTDRNDLMGLCCQSLDKYYALLKLGEFAQINQLYFSRLLGIDEWCTVVLKGKPMRIQVSRVNTDGLLVVRDQNAIEYEADVKDVTWLLKD